MVENYVQRRSQNVQWRVRLLEAHELESVQWTQVVKCHEEVCARSTSACEKAG